ncbi:hypothetical protein Tco_0097627 [Tanacetum coccineum]
MNTYKLTRPGWELTCNSAFGLGLEKKLLACEGDIGYQRGSEVCSRQVRCEHNGVSIQTRPFLTQRGGGETLRASEIEDIEQSAKNRDSVSAHCGKLIAPGRGAEGGERWEIRGALTEEVRCEVLVVCRQGRVGTGHGASIWCEEEGGDEEMDENMVSAERPVPISQANEADQKAGNQEIGSERPGYRENRVVARRIEPEGGKAGAGKRQRPEGRAGAKRRGAAGGASGNEQTKRREIKRVKVKRVTGSPNKSDGNAVGPRSEAGDKPAARIERGQIGTGGRHEVSDGLTLGPNPQTITLMGDIKPIFVPPILRTETLISTVSLRGITGPLAPAGGTGPPRQTRSTLPGASAAAHFHEGYELRTWAMRREVETLMGLPCEGRQRKECGRMACDDK